MKTTGTIRNLLLTAICPFMLSSCEFWDELIEDPAEEEQKKEENKNENGETTTVRIKDGLVAHYTFDDETCDDLTDSELDGSLYDVSTYVTETPNGSGKALFLNKNKYPDQKLNIPYNPLKGLTSFSVSIWVKDFSAGMLIGVSNGSKWDDYMRLYYKENGMITCRQYYEYEFSGCNGSSLIDGAWHLLTYVQVKGNAKLYVDGKLVDSQATYNGAEGSKGTRIVVDNHMKIDNIRIYNRAVNAKEVAAIYKAEK